MPGLHPRRRPWAVILGQLALTAVLLAACQGAGAGVSDEASQAAPSDAAPSAAASEPAQEPSEAASEAASDEPAADGVVLVAESPLGPILTDATGMTLYLFTNDSPGESACSADCLVNWPPLIVSSAADAVAGDGVAGELGTIEREDGSLQVTIADIPLYFFAGDSEPGDLSGHQVGGVWFAVGPDGAAAGEEAGQDDYEY
jgi:predicted lipoprotein with Yx(FWY)xxD motif